MKLTGFHIEVIDPHNLTEWIDGFFEALLGQMGWVLLMAGLRSWLAW